MSKDLLGVEYPENEIEELAHKLYLGFDPSEEIRIVNELSDPDYKFDDPVLDVISFMKKPENFWYTCQFLLNINLHPFQLAVLQTLWNKKFPLFLASRGASKTFMLGLYAVLRALFEPGCKIIVVGAAFRQSKLIFEYMEMFWRGSPILRNIVGEGKHEGPRRDIDRCSFYIGSSEIVAIPIGDGQKIRGLRGNYVLADEFASISQEVFEVVIRGFGSVSASPVERVWDKHNLEALRMLGYTTEADEIEEEIGFGNQTIITGTAYYAFNHFYEYWKRYKAIIESGGDEHQLQEIFRGEVPEDFDWTQYSIIRLPFQALPSGFMDENMIAQARAVSHKTQYLMEYCAVFAKDSDGFFKRSLIENCVCKNEVQTGTGEVVEPFEATLTGHPNKRYIISIDPASETDNFAITVLELYKNYRKIVYVWTMNREKLQKQMKKKGGVNDQSFYNHCARKIRSLLKIFPCDHVVIDSQGGGYAIMEALHDKSQLEDGEVLIWPYIKEGEDDVFWWEKEDKPTDGEAGRHILHMVQFANAEFTNKANHALRKDLESKVLLFPIFDTVTLADALNRDKILGREYDNLEDCCVEIEELKDELAYIEHTQTPSGRDKWDTPEIKLPGGKKGRMRKDRYSALVIGNYVAHVMEHGLEGFQYEFRGGFAGQSKKGQKKKPKKGQLYTGPEHLVSKMNTTVGRGIRK